GQCRHDRAPPPHRQAGGSLGRDGGTREDRGLRPQRHRSASRVREGHPRFPRSLPVNEIIAAMQNDTLLRALLREPTPYTPVWIMRQAGRYLPEYNETRRKAGSFLALAKTPELACEVTIQPLRRFALDAAIIFSDILTVPDAMGLGLYFAEGEGPKFERPLRDESAIAKLGAPDLDSLRYVFDAISLTRRTLADKVPLIGFAGSPFTLAC